MAPELPQGEYYHFQLIGLQVFTEEWETLGVVTEILRTGSNDVYVISGHGGDILVPALVDVIRKIDLAHGLMVVRLMEGLR
jgi:16S rRNA processing protein RimM